jgi:hypothetical protein
VGGGRSVRVQNGFKWLRKMTEFSGTQKQIIGLQKKKKKKGQRISLKAGQL